MNDTNFALEGYEDLEISTQIVIRDARIRHIKNKGKAASLL